MKKVVTRFAPSPTGMNIHIGNFRTALYAYAIAKSNDGEFFIRIEDTDRSRLVEGSPERILELFELFDLDVDRVPTDEQLEKLLTVDYPEKKWALYPEKFDNIADSNYEGVLVQSQRLNLYLKYAHKLLKQNNAYICFCSKERLKNLRERQKSKGISTKYDGKCKSLSEEEVQKKIKAGDDYVVRLDVSSFERLSGDDYVIGIDEVLGSMKYELDSIDDQVLIKSDGMPTYHMSVVVDDYLMNVSHIVRGYGWIPSIPKQVILYKMLGWEVPKMVHPTDVLDPDGGKLSKRKGAVTAYDFLKQGYLKEALLNFLMFLGWSPDIERKYGQKEKEIFPFDELVKMFNIDGITKANPIFDRQKLIWFNSQYIKRYSIDKFKNEFVNWIRLFYKEDKELKEYILTDENLDVKLSLFQERVRLLSEIPQQLRFFYKFTDIPNPKKVKGVKEYDIPEYSEIVSDYLEAIKNDYESNSSKWKKEKWIEDIRSLGDKYEWKHGDVFMLIRLIICGSKISPPLYDSMVILGKEEVLKRLNSFS